PERVLVTRHGAAPPCPSTPSPSLVLVRVNDSCLGLVGGSDAGPAATTGRRAARSSQEDMHVLRADVLPSSRNADTLWDHACHAFRSGLGEAMGVHGRKGGARDCVGLLRQPVKRGASRDTSMLVS